MTYPSSIPGLLEGGVCLSQARYILAIPQRPAERPRRYQWIPKGRRSYMPMVEQSSYVPSTTLLYDPLMVDSRPLREFRLRAKTKGMLMIACWPLSCLYPCVLFSDVVPTLTVRTHTKRHGRSYLSVRILCRLGGRSGQCQNMGRNSAREQSETRNEAAGEYQRFGVGWRVQADCGRWRWEG